MAGLGSGDILRLPHDTTGRPGKAMMETRGGSWWYIKQLSHAFPDFWSRSSDVTQLKRESVEMRGALEVSIWKP